MDIKKYRKDKLSSSYDVIIIGSGISGMCSAALLSMEGKKVLMLEKLKISTGGIRIFHIVC